MTSDDAPTPAPHGAGGLWSAGIRTVALFEAAKGTLVLAAGFGLLTLLHHRAGAIAEALLHRFHLNPAHRYPRIFLDAAENLSDARLWMLAAFAFAYAIMRLIEAYGLWHQRRWAEWFAVASGSIYVPVELYELSRGVTWPKAVALVVNLVIVGVMARALWIQRAAEGNPTRAEPSSVA